MKIEEYFPQKLALGNNFCNRIEEQKRLEGNINGVRPTLIMSPRRYGKTSLGVYVLEKLKIPYAHLDLFPLANSQDVQNTILGGIGETLASIESTPKKALKAVSDFFAELSISFQFVDTKIEVDFMRSGKSNSKTILNALKKLDATLTKKRRKSVLFLDEFQRLSQMQESENIEGAIRHVAQKSNHIVFLFSGSNRHLLSKMFDDRKRPLYKLCDRIILNRIYQENYIAFLRKMSKVTWGKFIDQDTIKTILELTECHPYYLNVLCSKLWRLDSIPNGKAALSCWHNYTIEEKSTVFKELEALSVNQLKLLIAFAKYDSTHAPLGDEFLSLTNMPISSVRQSLNVLKKKDYIYQDKQANYCILDPLIKYVLAKRPS